MYTIQRLIDWLLIRACDDILHVATGALQKAAPVLPCAPAVPDGVRGLAPDPAAAATAEREFGAGDR